MSKVYLPVMRQFLRAIKTVRERPITTQELADELGCKYDTARQYLLLLHQESMVDKVQGERKPGSRVGGKPRLWTWQ